MHTYGWYLRKYVADTRAHKAIPDPLLASAPRKVSWKDGKIASWGRYHMRHGRSRWRSREKVDLLDLYAIIGGQYNARRGERRWRSTSAIRGRIRISWVRGRMRPQWWRG